MTDLGSKKTNTSFKTATLIGFIFTAIAIAGVGFWYSVQSSGVNTELPVLKAVNTNFKVKPENPGGKIIPHQDSKVLEILEGLSENDNRTEKLRLPDAAPELPPIALEQENNIKNQLPDTQQKTSQLIGMNGLTLPKDKLEDDHNKTGMINDTINLTDIIDTDNKTVKSDAIQNQKILDNKNSENITEKTAIIAPANKPISPKKIKGEKTHKVQLAAFSKEEKARQQAAILMEKHKLRLDNIVLEVTRIDTGSSGIYWRVITEPLRKDIAISTCNLLNSAGQDCIVRQIRKEN